MFSSQTFSNRFQRILLKRVAVEHETMPLGVAAQDPADLVPMLSQCESQRRSPWSPPMISAMVRKSGKAALINGGEMDPKFNVEPDFTGRSWRSALSMEAERASPWWRRYSACTCTQAVISRPGGENTASDAQREHRHSILIF